MSDAQVGKVILQGNPTKQVPHGGVDPPLLDGSCQALSELSMLPGGNEGIAGLRTSQLQWGTKVILPHLLCVHVGTEEHLYIAEDLFSAVSDELESAILPDQSEEVPKPYCSFRKWVGGRGLLGFQDRMTD